jgi:putative redox protein
MAGEMKIQIRQTSDSGSEAQIRRHKIPIDRPEAKGGHDAGPMGGELFLAAVGGCFTSTLLAAIKARGSGVCSLQVEVTGTLVDSPTHFASVDLLVSANYAEREQFEKLVEIAEKGCIIFNTLKDKLELAVRIGATV